MCQVTYVTCRTQAHLPQGLRWEGEKYAHSHPQHTPVLLADEQWVYVPGSHQPCSTCTAQGDDQRDDDLCFSTCMVSLRHSTMMNSLSSHCTVLAHIYQSQKSQTEIWTLRAVNHHLLTEP